MIKKGQMSIEFIISTSVFILVMIFVLFSIYEVFPTLHDESGNLELRTKGYLASEVLLHDTGIWNGYGIENASEIGLSSGLSYILDARKVSSVVGCDSYAYNKTRDLLGLKESEYFILNITEINFSGGPDRQIGSCHSAALSLMAPRFWVTRHAVMQNSTRSIIKMEIVVY